MGGDIEGGLGGGGGNNYDMPTYDITDNGASIKIAYGENIRNILKDRIVEISIIKTDILKIDIGEGALKNIYIQYKEVATPETEDVEALKEVINAFLLPMDKPSITDVRIDGSPTYNGYAIPGSIKDESVWAIEKITITEGVTEHTWANGAKNYSNIWDDRDDLTYF